jgi:hypothetical protein
LEFSLLYLQLQGKPVTIAKSSCILLYTLYIKAYLSHTLYLINYTIHMYCISIYQEKNEYLSELILPSKITKKYIPGSQLLPDAVGEGRFVERPARNKKVALIQICWAYLHQRGLCCTWTCLHHRCLCCTWTCLHFKG